VTLSSSYTITAGGFPSNGDRFEIVWSSVCTLGANSVTIFGISLDSIQALSGNVTVVATYNGSAWIAELIQGELKTNAVTNPMLAQMPTMTIKGNNTGSTANADDLTVAEVQAMLGNQLWKTPEGISGPGTATSSISNIPAEITPNIVLNGNPHFIWGTGTNSRAGAWSVFLGKDNYTPLPGAGPCFVWGEDNKMGYGAWNAAIGDFCSINGAYSFGQGLSVVTRRSQFSRNTAVWNLGSSGSEYGHAQYTALTGACQTDSNSPTEVFLGSDIGFGPYIAVFENSVVTFDCSLTAFQTDGSSGTVGDTAVWKFKVTARNIGGTSAIVDDVYYLDNTGAYSTTPTTFVNDSGASAWAIDVDLNSAFSGTLDYIRIRCTGENNKNITWYLTAHGEEIKFVV